MIAIAIDDEPLALEVVRSHADRVPFLKLNAMFTNAFESLAYLQENKIDLIFLDIKMPDISGLELMNTLVNPPMVVFTTAYTEHAVKSFELDAVDYLLKPFSLARFLKACNKAKELYDFRNMPVPAPSSDFLFVKDGYEQIKVQFNEILFIEAAGNYTKIQLTDNRMVSTRITITNLQLLLPAKQFMRVHRAFVVAYNKIEKFDRSQIFMGSYSIPIGALYAQELTTTRS